MLVNKTVKMKWHYKNKEWYETKGYIFTKWNDEFEVKVEDLSDGSYVKVDIKCDGCGEILKNIAWKNYLRYVHEDGKYYCRRCGTRLFGMKKTTQTRLKNSISFGQWCYNNLSEYVADIIIDRWDNDLNIDKYGNKLTPFDVSFSSKGIDGKGYWFKCLEHPEHGSKQKDIDSFTSGQEGSIKCNLCNSISTTHPHLVKYFVNPEDAYKYSFGSSKKVPMKCPDCGYKKDTLISDFVRLGFSCKKCSDKIPYPEKFMFNVLEQLLDKHFKSQLTKTTLNWCSNYMYDFYLDDINCIIETHGDQHYKENEKWNMSLVDIMQNDKDKEELAKRNRIDNYIIIDCRKSEMEWIKKNIMKSDLPKLLNFKEEDINWLKAHEWACHSLVKVMCDLWNSGIKISGIADIFKINSVTVRVYLKKGAELMWCNYDALEGKRINSKKVICLATKEVFNSMVEAGQHYDIHKTSISACCRKRIKSTGKLPNGTKLTWMYYNEYLQTFTHSNSGIIA